MSFGFGSEDVFLVTTTWRLYKSCKESSEDFRRMSTELMSLHAVLGETRDYLEEHGEELEDSEKYHFSILMHGCQSSLEDLDALYRRYESLSTQAQRSWDRVKDLSDVRQRLVSNTTLLASFNTALINSSTSRIEKKLTKFITEVRAGMREGSVISVSDAATIIQSPDVWAELRRELEDVGISAVVVEERHDFIIDWLKNALADGLPEENTRVVGADDAGISSLTLITDESIRIRSPTPISDEGISIRNLTPTNDVENSSTICVEKKLDKFITEAQTGMREGFMMSVSDVAATIQSPDVWAAALRHELEDVGISVVDPEERHDFIREKEKENSKGGFWWRGRERRDEENELTRKIGFLTATASEDWNLVLDVCDHASATEANAKEAVRALRREFKYGKPVAQLAAARLWAIMLRNSSDTFISQSTSRKFLDTLEDLLTSSRTSPVVRERVMDVLAAAACASISKKDTGFRGLWRRVKPHDKPEEGMPFDTEDAMFHPPPMSRNSTYDHDINNAPVAPILDHDGLLGANTDALESQVRLTCV